MLEVFIKEDHKSLDNFIKCIENVFAKHYSELHETITIVQCFVLLEKYGLSLKFHNETLEWSCVDPSGFESEKTCTPMGAVFLWQEMRSDKFNDVDIP